MRKIGILTYHDGSNRGSILQAYSLFKSLQNNVEAKIEIINYRTFSREIAKLGSNPLSFIYRLIDFNTAGKFYQSQDALGDDLRITDDFNKAINFIKKQEFY